MATGYSKTLAEGSDSLKGPFTKTSEETFDNTCKPCENRNGTIVEAFFYCAICDDFCCQSCQQVHNSFRANRTHLMYGWDQMDKWGLKDRGVMLPTEICRDHLGETLKILCLNDNILCCDVCVSLHHRACSDLVYVPHISKDIKQSQDLSTVGQTIDTFINFVDDTISSNKKNQNTLDDSKNDYLHKIKDIRRQVNDFFNDLEKNASKELDKFHHSNKLDLKQHMKALEDVKYKLKQLQKTIQPSSMDNESQLFFQMFTAHQQLPEILHELKMLALTPQTARFHLTINPKLQEFLTTKQNLGEMHVDTTVFQGEMPKIPCLQLLQPTQSSTSLLSTSATTHVPAKTNNQQQQNQQWQPQQWQPQQQHQQQPQQQQQWQPQQQHQQQPQQQQQCNLYTASNGRDINIKLPSDKLDCSLYGACQMPNGDLFLTDKANKKVKRLNTKYEPIDFLDLPQPPRAIYCLGDNEVVVTDVNYTIHFLSVTSRTMSVTRSIQLDHNCSGIAHQNGRLFVSDLGKKIYMYTTSGKCLKAFQFDNNGDNIFSKTEHICVSPDGSNIYVADSVKGLVTLDRKGNNISTKGFEGIRGVCVESQGGVLVCGGKTHAVWQLDDMGSMMGQILDNKDGIDYPVALCVDSRKSELIVAMEGRRYVHNDIRVFDLK